jgi:hypothetical protein
MGSTGTGNISEPGVVPVWTVNMKVTVSRVHGVDRRNLHVLFRAPSGASALTRFPDWTVAETGREHKNILGT